MELVFLALLLVVLAFALGSGYPVAFALPGAAIVTISIAAVCGYLFAGGNVDAYFAQDGPSQWLSAGVTNLRGIYCCLLYTSPSPRDGLLSRMPSSA